MLFSSLEFLIFLPCTLLGFFLFGRYASHQVANIWLIFASLFFYGWWNPKYLLLIIPLIFINYFFALLIHEKKSKPVLTIGVVFNLAVLGYFKYANFFIDNFNKLAATDIYFYKVMLPLGISFFTFQKIAYLVDMYRGEVKEHNFIKFTLFVLFFPQLIAGPIVHHKEIIPQFADKKTYRFNYENISVGLTIFIIGLFKKVAIADQAGVYVSPVFNAAVSGGQITILEAWSAALCYSFQLYFDFSGYTDMAIGAARMFGIVLPLNFNSPYKSFSIIEFWRRWHMSLSRFLRDYVYIPLGGNRHGEPRRYLNLFLTMFLAGIWHGAGWTFVLWGTLHASYLVINHFYHDLAERNNFKLFTGIRKFMALPVTFILVVIGWVIFRAADLHSAFVVLYKMVDFKTISHHSAFPRIMVEYKDSMHVIILCFIITWFMPNTQDLLEKYRPALKEDRNKLLVNFSWHPVRIWALYIAALTVGSLISMALMEKSEFLYFDF